MTQCGVDPPRLRDVWSLVLLAHLVLRRVQSWQRRLESLRAELILLRRLRALRARLRLHAASADPAVVPLPGLTRRPRGTEAPLVCVSIVSAARTSGSSARARGMTDIAKAAGITREALYKALRPGSAPRFDTVNRVCAALGVRLVAQPLHPV